MKNLKGFLKYKINDLVEEALQFAKGMYEDTVTPLLKRRTLKKKIMPEEKVADESLTFNQEVKRSILQCIEKFYP